MKIGRPSRLPLKVGSNVDEEQGSPILMNEIISWGTMGLGRKKATREDMVMRSVYSQISGVGKEN